MNENNRQLKIVIILFILSLFIRLPFISSSPNHWDSVVYLDWCRNFVDAGRLPVTSLQHAHPLYIILLYIPSLLFYKLLGIASFEKSAILLSVFSSALSVIPMFYIAMYLFKRRNLAIISALLFSFCPVIWWFSEELMSDIPSVFFVLSGIAFGIKWFNTKKNSDLLISSFILGLSILIRVGNLFVLPSFFFLVFLDNIKNKRYTPLFISILVFVPYGIFVLMNLFSLGLTVSFLIKTTDQISMSLSRLFSIDSWLIFIKIFISSLTTPLSLLFLLSFVFIISEIVKRKEILYTNDLFSLFFILLWIVPYSLYWRSLPFVSQISRFIILIIPPVILLVAYVVSRLADICSEYIEKGNSKIIIFLFIFLFIFLIGLDHILMNYISFFGLLKNLSLFLSRKSSRTIIGFFFFISFISYFTYRLILWLTGNFKERLVFFLVLITSVLLAHITAYSLPVLILDRNRIQHEKAQALWFAENTPEDSLIVAGHEFPFDRYYAKPRQIVFVLYTDTVIRKVKRALSGKRRVFASSNSYVEYMKPELMEKFSFEIVGKIPAANLRNQKDEEFRYMNYATFKESYSVDIYELKIKKSVSRDLKND